VIGKHSHSRVGLFFSVSLNFARVLSTQKIDRSDILNEFIETAADRTVDKLV